MPASLRNVRASSNAGLDLTTYDDVRDRETTAGRQHTQRFSKNGVFVAREIDHAVRDDDVDRVLRQRNGLDRSLEKLDVSCASFALVLSRQCEHLVGHVEAIDLAGRAH